MRFCEANNRDIGKGFDLIVGTSTGGILAAGLAAGINIDKIIEIYTQEGYKIFTKPKPNHPVLKFLWAICCSISPANKNTYFKKKLEEIFKNETIGEVYERRKIGLCIQSLKLVDYSPRVFKTPHNPKKHADNKRKLSDICLATSAAPIIFPIASSPEPDNPDTQEHFIDGGIWSNNPTLIGLIEALDISQKDQSIEIISIGTSPASSGESLNPAKTNRGIMGWGYGVDILEASGNAQSRSVEFISKFLEKHLNNSGRTVKIYRLPQKCLSSSQEKVISLDKASKEACNTLISLGTEDGKEIYGMTFQKEEDPDLKMLTNIFNNIRNFNLDEGDNSG